MQTVATEKLERKSELYDLTTENISSLVSAFSWLIQEDKKQNPELYKLKKILNND